MKGAEMSQGWAEDGRPKSHGLHTRRRRDGEVEWWIDERVKREKEWLWPAASGGGV
jgi:hypothetical protein